MKIKITGLPAVPCLALFCIFVVVFNYGGEFVGERTLGARRILFISTVKSFGAGVEK